MNEATLDYPPKLTRHPFTDLPQAPDNEPSTKPPLLHGLVVGDEGDTTNTNKLYVLTPF